MSLCQHGSVTAVYQYGVSTKNNSGSLRQRLSPSLSLSLSLLSLSLSRSLSLSPPPPPPSHPPPPPPDLRLGEPSVRKHADLGGDVIPVRETGTGRGALDIFEGSH